MLFLSTVINYVDRQTLSVLAPVLTKELGITDAEYANVLTAFLAAYTLMYLGSGLIVDRWGPRLALFAFVTWWSLANMSHALAVGVWSLGALRLLLGLGEAGNFMAAFRVVSEWYPARERAFVHGLIQGGAALGAILTPPLVTWIQVHYGWRPAFLVTGAIGLVWAVGWLLLYHAPDRHPRITAEERTLVLAEAGPAGPVPGASWRELARRREVWVLMGARFLSDPVWWFYLFWLPKYLVEQRGFTLLEMGMLAWIPYLAADLGALTGGWLSGRFIAAGRPVLSARLRVMLPCALVMPVSFAIHQVPSRAATIALICVVTFAHMAWKANQTTLTNDLFPRPLIGSVSGLLAFGTGLGGTLFTWLTGQVVSAFGYGAIFVLMGLLHPAAYLVTRRFVRPPAAGAA